MKDFLNDWRLVGITCLTLGLAPFTPEPHILGKIRWIAGGANGMGVMDWWDFIMHGIPWFLLGRIGFIAIRRKMRGAS
jgi:hypothetical protein